MPAAARIAVLVVSLCLLTGIARAASPAESDRQELVFLTWSDYMDPELVEAFEKKHKARISFVYFETDDNRDEIMVESEGRGYDLMLVNGAQMRTYRKRGWFAPIDADRTPNLQHVETRWSEAFPDATGYGVPFFWGTLGIAYRKDLVNGDISSWLQLFRPAPELHGKIVMVKTSLDVIGMGLKALGHSANSTDPAALDNVEKLLLAQKPHVLRYSYVSQDEKSTLITGDAVAAMIYNGDAVALQEHHDAIRFVVPKEGGNIWIDYITVSESSRNKDLAWEFINFMNEPENAAKLAEFVYYATPNKAAEQLLPAEFLEDPSIYPSEEVLDRSEVYAPLPSRAQRQRNLIFSRVIR